MISDGELLAVCRAAGKPGTESHRLACRLYRRSVFEWQADTERGRREQEIRTTLRRVVALIAATADDAGLLDSCGTHNGYVQHATDKTLACPQCLEAERVYSRERKHAQKAARAQAGLEAAA